MQWPDPWLSLNPTFAPVERLPVVNEGLLQPECDRNFRLKAHGADHGGLVLSLHRYVMLGRVLTPPDERKKLIRAT